MSMSLLTYSTETFTASPSVLDSELKAIIEIWLRGYVIRTEGSWQSGESYNGLSQQLECLL